MATKKNIQLVEDYLKTIYNIDNDHIGELPDSLSIVPKVMKGRFTIAIKEIEDWPLGTKTKQFEWRITSLIRHLRIMREDKETYTDYDERLEQVNAILPQSIHTLAVYNARKYDTYKRTVSEPLSLKRVIKINKKTKGTYIIGNDITTVLYSTLVPKSIKNKILEALPNNPWDAYPEARAMHRHFIIHVGGTNTGKTYQSLERLKSVESGAYLGPLRLLAMEVYEKLNLDGVPCSLLTGEQEDDIPGAKHVASTIEMANYNTKYDVVVIDECQMIDDCERGGNWTEAIMGMLSNEIHLCVAPIGLNLCKKIIEDCGDTYEVIEHERFIPLEVEEPKREVFNLKKDLRDGDALIVFSRKAVLNLAQELNNLGIKASVIYGALPYETRKKQVESFVNGETKVVVSTDAIGMGLNLPIHRIVFMETSKFDGANVRLIKQEEIKQIAGRAGRRGMYTEGYVTTAEKSKYNYVKKNIEADIRPITAAYINFPESLIPINVSIDNILSVWADLFQEAPYIKQDVRRILRLISLMGKRKANKLTNKEIYDICTVPFDEENPQQIDLWKSYIGQYINHNISVSKPDIDCILCHTDDELRGYEEYYKELALYFGFAKKMGMEYDKAWLNKELEDTANKINELLIEEIRTKRKRCRDCGRLLPWDYKYGICEKCYKYRQSYRDNWNDYF